MTGHAMGSHGDEGEPTAAYEMHEEMHEER